MILPLGEHLLAVVADERRDHLGVGAGLQRLRARVDRRCGRAVVEQLRDGGVVALDEAVPAPLVLEDVGLEPLVRAARDAVDGVERAHRRVRARVDGGLERRQVEVPQPLLGHVGRAVVAPALRLAVGGVVLDARDDLVLSGVVAALRGLHARGGHDRVQVRVLAGGLGDAAPARLVRDVDHRAVDLLEADRGRLARADPVVVGGDVRVERAAGRQRDREDRAVAVDRVVGEQDRDPEPRLLDGDVLELVDPLRVDEAEHAAHAGLGLPVPRAPPPRSSARRRGAAPAGASPRWSSSRAARSTRFSTSLLAAGLAGSSAASSLEPPAAYTPPATPAVTATAAMAVAILPLRIFMGLPFQRCRADSAPARRGRGPGYPGHGPADTLRCRRREGRV